MTSRRFASVTFQNGGQIKVVFEEEQEVIWIAHYSFIFNTEMIAELLNF